MSSSCRSGSSIVPAILNSLSKTKNEKKNHLFGKRQAKNHNPLTGNRPRRTGSVAPPRNQEYAHACLKDSGYQYIEVFIMTIVVLLHWCLSLHLWMQSPSRKCEGHTQSESSVAGMGQVGIEGFRFNWFHEVISKTILHKTTTWLFIPEYYYDKKIHSVYAYNRTRTN